MFAARDQENLIHARQTTAAAKPQNQGVKHLQPKTPGNKAPKTPFKIPLNDENDPLRAGGKTGLKTIGKGNENVIQSSKKEGGVNRNVFITPGPRDRAPLGLKVTNAKGKAFQTPAPLDHTIKTQKRSSTRKAKVHHDPVQESITEPMLREEEDYPDVEYAPPTATPLPDPPIDITYDDTFPQFKGENMTRGWWDEYANQKGSDGLTDWERKDKREREEYDKQMDAVTMKAFKEMEIPGWNVRAFPDEECFDEREARLEAEERAKRQIKDSAPAPALVKKPQQLSNPKTARAHPAPSTIRSRNAASALSHPNNPTTSTSIKAVRAALVPKPKVPSFLSGVKPTPAPSNPSPMRHTASSSTSRQTLGYSKGRSVSGALRPTLKSSTFSATPTEAKEDYSKLSIDQYIKQRGAPPVGSERWYEAMDMGYFENATDALDGKLKIEQGLEGLFADMDVGEAEEEDLFQLSLGGLGIEE